MANNNKVQIQERERENYTIKAETLCNLLNTCGHPGTGIDDIDGALDGLSITAGENDRYLICVRWEREEHPTTIHGHGAMRVDYKWHVWIIDKTREVR